MAAWLDAVECDADVNGVPLRFQLRISDGQITHATITELHSGRSPRGAELVAGRTLVSAANGDEYAAAVEALMLDRLGLEPIYAAPDSGQRIIGCCASGHCSASAAASTRGGTVGVQIAGPHRG